MQTIWSLLVKFVMTFVFAALAFFYLMTNPIMSVFWVALAATVINYLVGDLMVLPAFGNTVASIGDGIMAGLVAYVAALATPMFTAPLNALLIFAVLVGIGEYFFHQFLKNSEKVAP